MTIFYTPNADHVGGPPPQGNGLVIGTIGWSSDGGNPYELGDGDNDGTSLVHVTTFEGKDPTVKLQAGVGQGQRLLCQVSQDIIVLPAYGTRVLVAMPGPSPKIPGHSVVIAALGNTQWQMAGNSAAGDIVIPCPLGPARIIMRHSGSITLVTQASDGSDVALWLQGDGFHVVGPFGSISLDKYGFRVNAGGGPSINLMNIGGLPPPFDILAGSVAQISAGTVKLDGLQVLAGPDSPDTDFMPIPVCNDQISAPGPAPSLDSLLIALSPYFAALESIAASLLAQPQYTGVTGAQFTALEQAKVLVAEAFTQTASILSSTTFRVAYPQ